MCNNVNGIVNMKLTDQLVRSFQVAKDFSENVYKISAIDYSTNGKQLVSCENDDKIVVYDCDKGTSTCTINTKKYGGDLIHFVPEQNSVIHSSTRVNDEVRYLSLDGKGYLRYFPGHTRKVISLSASPLPGGNSFLSGSMDHTVRLWDLNASHCQAVLRSSGQTIAAYDPEGIIFAAGVDSEAIKLYDLRSFDKGPFISFKLNRERDCEWTRLKFSADGKSILIGTNGNVTRLVDAYTGEVKMTFRGPANKAKLPIEASFSPDSQLIFTGGADGRVHVWNAIDGKKVCALDTHHRAPVQCVQFNPQHMMLASGGQNLAFWLPNPENLLPQ